MVDPFSRFSIGQFFGPVALQVMSNTHPGEYLIPLYTQASGFVQYGYMSDSCSTPKLPS